MTNTVETMAPGWYPDPEHRHAHRFWDGTQWTDQVADQGTPSTDPLSTGPAPTPSGGSRTPLLTVALVLIGLTLLALGAFALFGGDEDGGGNGGTAPSGGPLAGDYQVEGTNSDGSPYRGTAVITGNGPDYRVVWTTGSSTSSGRGTLEGDTFTTTFSGDLTGSGTATYQLEDDGRLVGTWTVQGAAVGGTETLTPA